MCLTHTCLLLWMRRCPHQPPRRPKLHLLRTIYNPGSQQPLRGTTKATVAEGSLRGTRGMNLCSHKWASGTVLRGRGQTGAGFQRPPRVTAELGPQQSKAGGVDMEQERDGGGCRGEGRDGRLSAQALGLLLVHPTLFQKGHKSLSKLFLQSKFPGLGPSFAKLKI